VNPNLKGDGEELTGAKFYVWLYRHNYTDTGLYQLYVSVKGEMLIGSSYKPGPIPPGKEKPHRDIQALGYEFGRNPGDNPDPVPGVRRDIDVPVEIWRGAVVRVNARGGIEVVGNEAGVVAIDDKGSVTGVESAPVSAWEVAPPLQDNKGNDINPHYKPKNATGAGYVLPEDRKELIPRAAGDVQKEGKVKTYSPFRYRAQ